ncbi:hypothetical protein M408DRAFT_136201 [Serendipita vermifera MAFF 305830]|uniref:F-box domain-containing protein n=1 Tax=Serendipita vermifera MAFF 305830 TaxID=933852 RepID=A0A0C3BAP8_SERVB|nr:hypothetical protein M408DRAFT_136201 [Serendipita vermifera MAFF 305830]
MQLPLDVLRIIFTEYAKQETPEHPLETLLLICKTWTRLCLQSPLLWSRFDISISDACEARRWATIVPKRLARSGPASPLHIVIMNRRKPVLSYCDVCGNDKNHLDYFRGVLPRVEQEDDQCWCLTDSRTSIESILQVLAGNQGFFCHRWVTLHLSLHFADQLTSLYESLVYPTPNLRTLTIRGVIKPLIDQEMSKIFPSTPILSDLSLALKGWGRLPVAHGLTQTGSHLGRLEIERYKILIGSLPLNLVNLRSLVMRHSMHRYSHLEPSIISVPNLTSFILEINIMTPKKPEYCFVIPFDNLQTLGLFQFGLLGGITPTMDSFVGRTIMDLLRRAKNVKQIAGDTFSIAVLFHILSQSPLPAGISLTTGQLTICVMERNQYSRIESIFAEGERVYTINMGDDMIEDIERIKQVERMD